MSATAMVLRHGTHIKKRRKYVERDLQKRCTAYLTVFVVLEFQDSDVNMKNMHEF